MTALLLEGAVGLGSDQSNEMTNKEQRLQIEVWINEKKLLVDLHGCMFWGIFVVSTKVVVSCAVASLAPSRCALCGVGGLESNFGTRELPLVSNGCHNGAKQCLDLI